MDSIGLRICDHSKFGYAIPQSQERFPGAQEAVKKIARSDPLSLIFTILTHCLSSKGGNVASNRGNGRKYL